MTTGVKVAPKSNELPQNTPPETQNHMTTRRRKPRLPKPKKPQHRPGESFASLDARWQEYERRLLGDPTQPQESRPTIEPSLSGIDRCRELALTAIMDRFARVAGVPVMHRNRAGRRFAVTITDPTQPDTDLLVIVAGRLANHARRLLFTIESERFDADRVRWWLQSIHEDNKADDSLADLIESGRRLGLVVEVSE